MVLRQAAPEPVVRAVAVAPQRNLRIARRSTVHARHRHSQLGFEQQAVGTVGAVIAGKRLEQRRAVEPEQVVGGALILDRVGLLRCGVKLGHEGVEAGLVNGGGVLVAPAVLTRLLDCRLLPVLLLGRVAKASIAARRGYGHMGIAAGVLAVGVAHAEGVSVRGVTLFGLLGEGDPEVFQGKGNRVFALVADAFAVGLLHEGVQLLDALIAPGIELLGDANRIVEHHAKALGIPAAGGKP
ncbi:hypothetical protein D9M71_405660 [compost metagenome]